ncbi:hypothetical protein GVC69_004752 [Salmonella enterica]|nr:hypothetical protein [Salmonella enterica]EEG2785535.1 hypothetical protein [Salmonella enterica]EEJ3970778.1 hypothetical protein [Salmonella enterica subsp. enterica serovar Gatuni]
MAGSANSILSSRVLSIACCIHSQAWTDPTTVDKFCPHDEACSKASGLTPPR